MVGGLIRLESTAPLIPMNGRWVKAIIIKSLLAKTVMEFNEHFNFWIRSILGSRGFYP